MKRLSFLSLSAVLFFFFSSNLVLAQSSNTYQLQVIEGQVSITGAFCRINPCSTTRSDLAGTFSAEINSAGDKILFPSSNVVTNPNVNFQFPQDPNEDSHGVVREFAFTFTGQDLKGKGFIDSRAFDGPLVEYYFVAKVVATTKNIYFTARPDFRKCVSPLCGGYFVKAVNKKRTVCADGSLREECYVASIEYGKSPVSIEGSFANNTPLFLVGEIQPRLFPNFGNLGTFKAKLVARSATEKTATTTFYGISNNGIVCITDPCFSYDQQRLNSLVRITKLSDINLEMSGATPDAIAKAYSILATGEPLYASGKNQRYIGLGGVGIRFVAEQFYLPLTP